MRKWFTFCFFITGCVSAPPVHIDPAQLVFPYGSYRHRVHVEPMGLSLVGVVKTAPDEIHLVALTPFNTTLMKLDDRRSDVKLEVYDDSLKQRQSDLLRLYPVLRSLLLLTRDQKDAELKILKRTPEGDPLELSYRGRVQIQLSDFHGRVPHHMALTHSAFQLQIEVEPL